MSAIVVLQTEVSIRPSTAAFAALNALLVSRALYNSKRNAPISEPRKMPIIVPIMGNMLRSIPPTTAPAIVPMSP